MPQARAGRFAAAETKGEMTMKSAIIAIALLSGSAALAQTDIAPPPADLLVPAQTTPIVTDTTMPEPITAPATAPSMTMASTGQTAMPGNAAPERDARGIAVVSDPANVPAGYNGTADALNGTGGPLLDPATGAPAATPDASYPACTRTVTDNCVQRYERHRR
jgi:hypothetical protein